MDTGVVIVAAGRGERLGEARNKAMVLLDEVPLFLHSVRAFDRAPSVRELVVVTREEDRDELASWLDAVATPVRIVPGGERRQDSALNGLRAVSSGLGGAMVHDAARPFVTPAVIERLAAALDEHEAVIPVLFATSTVKRVDAGGFVETTLPRDGIALAQTPQAARRELLVTCLEAAPGAVTDEAQAIEAAGRRVRVVPDSAWNFKVTTPEDLRLAEIVIRQGLREDEA